MGLTDGACIFTGVPMMGLKRVEDDGVEYIIKTETRNIPIRISLHESHLIEDDEFFKKNKYLFEGLLLNNDWFEDTKQIITIKKLKELLSQKKFPITPKEKADNLFEYLLKQQK